MYEMKSNPKSPHFSFFYKWSKVVLLILIMNENKFQDVGIFMFLGKFYFPTTYKKLID